MFHTLFGAKERKPAPPQSHFNAEGRSSALKIIHAGGTVEYYYMAVPASGVMEKYPSCILARPEVFKRPWDSVVRPEEILVPGQKFYVVPKRTVKKLKRRVSKIEPDDDSSNSPLGFLVSECKDELSNKSYLPMKDVSKPNAEKRHVSFTGIDKKSGGNDQEKRRKKRNGGLKKSSSSSKSNEVKTRRVKMITWEPSLTVISECHVE
ncbi:hypothetical protein DCAR_0522490 [Daucus carota subsp. sativus]|uniref:Uncharacterized protein n=1 Tax=Daucus carota subsp. sativus TaxID=79200 RepID=A0A164ZUF7_DAUCS|nr:hypothetical protein DCAR_0522490 [Daucus carota subsp. sativus]